MTERNGSSHPCGAEDVEPGEFFLGPWQMRQKSLTFPQESLRTGQASVRQSQTFKSNFNTDLSMNVNGEARGKGQQMLAQLWFS